jgi:hypothetical protein
MRRELKPFLPKVVSRSEKPPRFPSIWALSCIRRLLRGEGLVKRPRRAAFRYPNKPKSLDKFCPAERLEHAAVNATYLPSDYHCRGSNGERPKRRAKPTMLCPRQWTIGEARVALREAIRLGQISKRWVGSFPRYVWHREAEVWYEARTSDGTPGTYHAYPIEPTAVPVGL